MPPLQAMAILLFTLLFSSLPMVQSSFEVMVSIARTHLDVRCSY